MTLQDTLIRNTALALSINEDIVMRVISYQWKTAKEVTGTGSIIELSGLGRFQSRMNKVNDKLSVFNRYYGVALRDLEALDKEKDEGWYSAYKKVKGLEKDLQFLKAKKIDPTLIAFRADKENRKQRAKQKQNNES